MPDNKITEVLAEHGVTVTRLRLGTQLGNRTCYRVVNDPTAHFRPETARILQEWICANIGNYSLESLFASSNLVSSGALPQVPQERTAPRKGMTICDACHMETRAAATCSICGEALHPQNS